MLLDRAAEIAVLAEALDDVAAGRPRILVLEGEPGIGKSTLLDELISAAVRRGASVASATGNEFDRDRSFGTVRSLLGPLVARRAATLDGAASIAAPVLDPPAAEAPPMPGEDAVLHGLYWVVANLTASGPLVLALDDGQWADPASLRWLDYLASRIDGLPVLLVVTARPTRRDALAELKRHRTGRVVLPRPLGAGAVGELLADRLGAQVDAPFAAACLAATEGNPLLLEYLVRELAGAGTRPVAGEADQVQAVGPDTVARHTERRIAELPAAAAAVLAAVAVLGDEAGAELLVPVSGLAADEVAEAARELSSAGILHSPPRTGFVHPIVRSAVHRNLSAESVQACHLRAAQALLRTGEARERIARHVRELRPGTMGSAVEVLRAAAGEAMARADTAAAVASLRRAMEEKLSHDEEFEVLAELGLAELNVDGAAAARDLGRAHALADTPQRRTRIAVPLAQSLAAAGQIGTAMITLDASMPDAAQDDRWRLEADAITLALLHHETRQLGMSRLNAFAGVEDTLQSGPGAKAALGILAARRSWVSSDRANAIRLAERSLASGTLCRAASPSFFYAALALARAGRLDLSAMHLREMIEHARRTGGMVLYQVASAYQSYVSWMRGQVRDALSQADAALTVTPRSGWTELLVHVAVRADALAERDDVTAGMDTLAEAGLTAELPDQFETDIVLHTRGRLRMELGDVDGAAADFGHCGAMLLDIGIVSPSIQPWRSHLARTQHLLGQQREAERLIAEEMRLSRAWGAPNVLGNSLRAAGAVRADPGSLTEAVTVLDGSGAELDLAKAHLELGELLARRGQRTEAREHLRAAVVTAQRCGGVRVARRATEQLVAAGGRPRQLAHTGLDALTPAEWQVARLAARRLRNQDIAESLFVTKRTVELHLTSVYRKLHVSGRAALAAVPGLTGQAGPDDDPSRRPAARHPSP